MAGWRPLKRRDFTRKLRAIGFDGPYSGTRHQFMISGQHRQTIPHQFRILRAANPAAPPAGRGDSGAQGCFGGMEFLVKALTAKYAGCAESFLEIRSCSS